MAVGEAIVAPLLNDGSRIAIDERLIPVGRGGIAHPVGEAGRAQHPATAPALQGNATAHAKTRAGLRVNFGEWVDVNVAGVQLAPPSHGPERRRPDLCMNADLDIEMRER